MPVTEPIRLLLVDDQALVRRGLRRLLEMEDGVVEVVGEAADGNEALTVMAALDQPPEVALVDARMPGMPGLALIEHLRQAYPGVATLLLTTFDDDELLFGSLAAGAGGFLLKDAEPEELVQAIRSVQHRTMVVDGSVAARVVARLHDPGAAGPGPSAPPVPSALPPVVPGSPELTDRESEIARLVATGASNREIATQLYLNEGTVKNHVSAALRKLGLRDRTQLAVAVRDSHQQH